MNKDEFDLVVEENISQMRASLQAKGAEYCKGQDRLQNFKDTALMNGCTPEQALWGFVSKHIIALKDFIQSPGMQNIPYSFWSEKLGDIRNYMVLLDALITERTKDED
jgi:hypothetical protein